MTTAEKLTTIAENQQKVYEAGAAVAQKKPYLDTSKPVPHYQYVFYSDRWFDQLDKFDLSNITDGSYMFQNSRNKLTTVPELGTSNATRMQYIFYDCQKLEEIKGVDFSSCPSSTATNMSFHNCVALKKITINGVIPCSISFGSCRVLNKASIEGIVDALSDTATGQTITFSQLAVNAAFTTDELTALEATKSNWSFAYA